MSRSYLYRSAGPARPLLSLVIAAAWLGAGLLALLGTAPHVVGGLPLHGPAAAVLERLFALLAGGAVLGGTTVITAELVVGRTRSRGVRLAGAVLLLAAGGAGMLDGARRLVRPGTPAVVDATTAPLAATTSAALAVERLLWSGMGLVGSVLVLGGSLGAIRSWDRLS